MRYFHKIALTAFIFCIFLTGCHQSDRTALLQSSDAEIESPSVYNNLGPHDDGYMDGDCDGMEDGKSAGFEAGYSFGEDHPLDSAEYDETYENGYQSGYKRGYTSTWLNGYIDGYLTSHPEISVDDIIEYLETIG